MPFRFNFRKAFQAVGVLLRYDQARRMNYTRLIKLLYIADRESFRETGRPITGDHVVAMPRGPVLNGVYDLIRGRHIKSPQWDAAIHRERYDVLLRAEVPVSALSRYDMDKLNEVSQRYAECDEWDMVNITHEFPEWLANDPGDSSKPIPWRDIATAVGRDAEFDAICREEAALHAVEKLLGG